MNALMGKMHSTDPPSPADPPTAAAPTRSHPHPNIDPTTLSEEVFDPSAGRMSAKSALQSMLCLLTGYCWGLALVYAGTAEASAKHVLLQHLKLLHW